MKKCKAILAILLIVALFVTLFAACAKEETPDNPTNSTGINNNQNNDTTNNDATNNDDADHYEPDEVVDVVMAYIDINQKADTCDDMEAAFNAISEPELGVRLDIRPFNFGSWATQLGNMINGGERLDIMAGIMTMGGVSYTALVNNNALIDLTPYLAEDYAAGIVEAVGHLFPTVSKDGGVYALPSKRDTAASINIVMRKDILEELNLLEKATNMKTWAEYEEILAAVQDAYGAEGMYAVTNNDGNGVYGINSLLCTTIPERGAFDVGEYYDTLGDNTATVCVDFDGNVTLLQENEYYVDVREMVKSWLDNGYLFPDASFTQETGRTLMRNGIGFSTLNNGEGQLANDFFGATGYEVVCVPVNPQVLNTSVSRMWGAMIPITCEEPEASVRLLNALYTDERLINLLTYGVEGEDYTLNEAGEAIFSVSDAKWKGSDWVVGNMFLTHPQVGTGGDYRDRRLVINQEQAVSPYNGFALDTSAMDLVISQLTAVNDQYIDTLNCGGYTEELHAEYLSKLESAGVNEYLAEVQTQLDAWIAANK